MKLSARQKRILLASGILLSAHTMASAQFLPPHVPGTICATPIGWCWLPQPFPLGSPCLCPGPYQPVQGSAS